MTGRFFSIPLVIGALTLSLLIPGFAADTIPDAEPDPVAAASGILSEYDAVSPADGSLSNYHRIYTYRQGQFEDVRPGDWFSDNVAAAYEYGILVGTSDSRFGAGEELTVAQAVAIADRLHNQYYGGSGEFVQGELWYQVYMDYADQYGILVAGKYDPLSAATRAQFAEILSAALPDEALAAINYVEKLPDVDASAPYASAVLRLYNAGILTGNDGYGTFGPQQTVNREQIAAMATRVADPDLRQALDLLIPPDPCIDAYKAFLAQERHEDEWSYTIKEFALFDINQDGIPELITHGGGQMDYTKIFTVRDGTVEYVHWGTTFGIYDNGLIEADYGSGAGYRLYTLYRIDSRLQLELVYRYAEWYGTGTTYYAEGEDAYEESSPAVPYDKVMSTWNSLVGAADLVDLNFVQNTAGNRAQL